ncbi:PREDICTED: uncharacterized protein LOC108568634 [Nicrophorus vespilloides]|uniref:Uncharacterized protein LOC108568634 n=1 Tax=Nicrophorus vespilloides TaxID=110193 RepID=A0ABM1NES4_NICVS|nr:PREDICTED: uncharacterized protein LOC108568634 [Nicrophorus vespilloides]
MNKFIFLFLLSATNAYLYNPYYRFFRYHEPYYGLTYANPYLHHDNALNSYSDQSNYLYTLNVLAEVPHEIKNDFTVVPLLVVAQESMKMINDGDIMGVSQNLPMMTVKTKDEKTVQCSPAVKITLKKPIFVYTLKSTIVFPSEIGIVHGDYRIPITVGAVIAPIPQTTYVSLETPARIEVVYAVPTSPITLDYINNSDVVSDDGQAVVVESAPDYEPQNITIINFPDKQAEPVLDVDEENSELVNRNPPMLLAPAGIVQSTQPQTIVSQFINSKESPVLIAIREESLKHRL